ncbi:MAG: glycosyltransferase family 2 protein [Coriobacteriales bacterium]|nr:glycosyltransferase family 2 protein [Coriobacteriales bacterium]
MNPVIVIPTYVSGKRRAPSYDVVTTYDHVTPITHQGELPRCLASLRDREVAVPIILLVAAEPGVEDEAAAKIREIATAYREQLTIQVVDAELLDRFYALTDDLGFTHLPEGVALRGYGAIRNLGLVIAAIRGFTEVIFIDDDEVIIDPDFLKKAMYGLGKLSKKGIPVLVKSGFFIDRKGMWKSSQKQSWYNRCWAQGELFNEWIAKAMSGPRLSRSNSLYGGLMAIHREAYRRVAFDPWISRGEDLDYLLNLRMYGGGVWFDNKWSIQHLPPVERTEAQRFRQDIYRWIYEHRKLEYSKTQIDLLQIAPHSLDPYPGPFLDHSITSRVFITALLRVIGRSADRSGYLKAAIAARREAKAYAEVFCARYFEFQASWPQVLGALENDPRLKALFGGESNVQEWETQALESGAEATLASPLEDVFAAPPAPYSAGIESSLPTIASDSDQPAREEGLLDFDLDLKALGLED